MTMHYVPILLDPINALVIQDTLEMVLIVQVGHVILKIKIPFLSFLSPHPISKKFSLREGRVAANSPNLDASSDWLF